MDEKGEGLVGATVTVKGPKVLGTTTDGYGFFLLKKVDETSVIEISFLGYVKKEVSVAGNEELGEIKLDVSESKLDEIQVMAYGKTSRRLSTGNITTIKSDEISKQLVDNPLLAMMGKVPNMVITPSSGLPGASISVQIRGRNSFVSNLDRNGIPIPSEPLFVIDGIPYPNNILSNVGANQQNALSFINPSDIEEISVLSDADATSIYGSRAGNGVVLITTKKGKSGRTDVNAQVQAGFSQVTKRLELLNTQQYLEMRKEAFKNDNLTPSTNPFEQRPGYAYAPDLLLWDQDRYTDWQKIFLGNLGLRQSAQVSITGGSPLVQYFISGTYHKQGYVYPGENKDQSGSGHFSLSATSANNKLKSVVSSSFLSNSRFTSSSLAGYQIRLAPNAPNIFNEDGTLNWEPNPNTINGVGTWNNPYALLLNSTDQTTYTLNNTVDVSYKIFSDLSIKVQAGFSQIRLKSLGINPIAAQDPAFVASNTGNSAFYNNLVNSWSLEPQLNYKRNIGKGKFDVLLGASYQGQSGQSEYINAIDYRSDALLKSLAAAGGIGIRTSVSSAYRYLASFARLSYNWEDKYLLNLSARRDGSSRFGPDNKFGNFWSVGGAWIFSQEPFLKNKISFLSFGKVRMSYGSSGQDGIGDYRYIELYESIPDVNLPYQGLSGALQGSGATNPYYGWEDVRKMELALETGFFKDRLLFNVSFWRNRSSNQLGLFPLPATGGASEITLNQEATIQNMGWDVTFSTKNVTGNKFRWSTSTNFGLSRNKLLHLPQGFSGYLDYYAGTADPNPVGKPFSGIKAVREFSGVNPLTGLYQFKDGTNAIVSGGSHFSKVVNLLPKYQIGLTNSLAYLGFSLDFSLEIAKQKGKNYIHDLAFIRAGFMTNLPVAYLDRWQNAGDVSAIGKVFVNDNTVLDLNLSAVESDANFVDASYIRINNIQFSYNASPNLATKLKFQSLRLSLTAQNLLTITGYGGLDPQIQDVTLLPMLRTLTFGIHIGL